MADATLKFNKTAIKNRRKKLQKAQNYLDNELVKLMTPLVPVARKRFIHAGKLRDSVKIAEPGKIVYTARFARKDYYSFVDHTHGGNPKAKRLFFEVVKAEDGAHILEKTAKIAGTKAIQSKRGKNK